MNLATALTRPRKTKRRLALACVLASLVVLPTAVRSQSSITKPLYLFDSSTADPNGFNVGAQPYLSRTPPISLQDNVIIDKPDPPTTWIMTPALQSELTVAAGTIPVTLYLGKGGGSTNPVIRTLTVELSTVGALNGPLGDPVTQSFFAPSALDPAQIVFEIPLASGTSLPAGTQIALTLTNITDGGGVRRLRVFPTSVGDYSRIELPVLNAIEVESTDTFDASYPGGVQQSNFASAATVSVRADVSDPFGALDIGIVVLDVYDESGAAAISGQSMSLVQGLNGASSQYEYSFTLPQGSFGQWTYDVTAFEGTEGTVFDILSGSFLAESAILTFTKSVTVLSDPVNGSTNPKAIPGAVVLYTLTVANSGATGTDAGSIVVGDVLPPYTALYVDSAAGDPIVFVDGSPASGLVFDYPAAVGFSSQPGGGPPYDYLPSPDSAGFDPFVTGLQLSPSGALTGNAGSGAPSFEIRYRSRIN